MLPICYQSMCPSLPFALAAAQRPLACKVKGRTCGQELDIKHVVRRMALESILIQKVYVGIGRHVPIGSRPIGTIVARFWCCYVGAVLY